MEENNKKDVPYVVYESTMARMERISARLWVVILVTLTLLVMTNIAWMCYENQFEESTTTIEAEQETANGGSNYLVNGNYGKTESENNH